MVTSHLKKRAITDMRSPVFVLFMTFKQDDFDGDGHIDLILDKEMKETLSHSMGNWMPCYGMD